MKIEYLIIPITLLIAITMVVAADQNTTTTWDMADNGIPRIQEQESYPEPNDPTALPTGMPLEKAPRSQNSFSDSLTFILAQGSNDLVIAQVSPGNERRATVDLTKQDIINVPDLRSKGAGFLTVIYTTPFVNRTENGDLTTYRFRFITDGCPKIQPANVTDVVYF
jgi:hypothetical protein